MHAPRPGTLACMRCIIDSEPGFRIYWVKATAERIHFTQQNTHRRAILNQVMKGWDRYGDTESGHGYLYRMRALHGTVPQGF